LQTVFPCLRVQRYGFILNYQNFSRFFLQKLILLFRTLYFSFFIPYCI